MSLAIVPAASAMRIVVDVDPSLSLSQPSMSLAEPCSAIAVGAAGSTVSLMKTRSTLTRPALPATSITRAESVLAPSAPRLKLVTTKSTEPVTMSAAESTIRFAGVNDTPLTRSSSVSPATAPDVPSATRIAVEVSDSIRLSFPSASLVEPCSAGAPVGVGTPVSFVNERAPLVTPMLPIWLVILAVMALPPSAARSAVVTVKSANVSAMWATLSVITLAVGNDEPLSSSSSVSPTTAPAATSPPTRIVVGLALSAKLRYPSASFDVIRSTGVSGADGAAVFSVKAIEPPATPTLPA